MVKQRFENLRLAPKLMLSYMLLTLVVLVLFALLYSAIMDKMVRVTIEANLVAHRQAQNELEQRMEEFERLVAIFQSEPNMNRLLNGRNLEEGESILLARSAQEALPNIALSNSDLLGFYIYVGQNGYVVSNARVSLSVERYYDELYAFAGMDYEGWVRAMQGVASRFLPSQQFVWDGQNGRCIPYLRPLFSASHTGPVGQVVFLIREQAIMDFFSDSLSARASYVCLLDEQGNELASRGNAVLASAMRESSFSDGAHRLRADGQDWIVLQSTSEKGFRCLSILAESSIAGELADVRAMIFTGIFAMLLTSVLLSVGLAIRNTRQLRAMLKNLRAIGYQLRDGNELSQLNRLILSQRSTNESIMKESRARKKWTRAVLLERLLDGREIGAPMREELMAFLSGRQLCCAYLDLRANAQSDGAYAAHQWLRERLEGVSECVPFFRALSEGHFQLVYVLEEKEGALRFFQGLAEQAARAGFCLLCCVGPAVHDCEELPISANNALREAMRHDPAEGEEVVLCERGQEIGLEWVYTPEMEKCLIQHCLQGNGKEAAELLHQIQFAMVEKGVASQLAAQLLMMKLLNTLLEILNDLPGQLQNQDKQWVMRQSIEVMRSQSLKVLFDFAGQCVKLFCNHAAQARDEKLFRRVEEIDAYIEENLSDPDLRLLTIAEHFGLSERYLSDFYKKSSGQNISYQVEKVRMERAHALLRQGMAVGDVAQRVGYLNVNTFRRAYRRHYGINPSEEGRDG